jgi:hypothetical protein
MPLPRKKDDGSVEAHYAGLERLPDHELIRRDAAAHPERGYREHVEAAREIAAKSYREDLRRWMRPGLAEEEEA